MSTPTTKRVRVKLTFEIEYDKPLDAIPHSLAVTNLNAFIVAGLQATSLQRGIGARRERSRAKHILAGATASYALVFPRRTEKKRLKAG